MALLSFCWLIIEFYIIPDGFLKWFYLSFYVHPFFLLFCQLFLWLKALQRWLLFFFFLPFRITVFICSFVKRVFVFAFSFCIPTRNIEVFHEVTEQEVPCIPTQTCEKVVVDGRGFLSRIGFETGDDRSHGSGFDDRIHEVAKEEGMDQDYCKHSWLNEYLYSDHYTSYLIDRAVDDKPEAIDVDEEVNEFVVDNEIMITAVDEEINEVLEDFEMISPPDQCLSTGDLIYDARECFPSFCGSSSPIVALDQECMISRSSVEEDVDTFHQKYGERMRLFDALYQERLCGMKAILSEHSTSAEPSTYISGQYISWSKMTRKRLLRSLECDLELICVAQSCLLWEALHHEYQKVVAVMLSNISTNTSFRTNVLGKLQELQILLERFTDDQKYEGQGCSGYLNKRISFQCQLKVPQVTGYVEAETSRMEGEAIRPTEVLNAIDKCIQAFWLYVKTDYKTSFWKYKVILRSHPPVEDPKDLELLYQVTKAFNKKKVLLKDLQGKRKCWLRRKVKPVEEEEDEKRNVLFALMDMKLVQRLLNMSLISTSHLKWCQEKLNNLEFREGKVDRVPISHLFPFS